MLARPTLVDIAHVMQVVGSTPNLRDAPAPGDLEGQFDRWFDGGAVRMVTGYNVYRLQSGARAITTSCDTGHVISISFAGEYHVELREVGETDGADRARRAGERTAQRWGRWRP